VDELIQYTREHAGVEVLYFLFAASAAEYLVPPLPADSVVAVSALLVLAEKRSLFEVYVCVVAGGVLGASLQYGLGRFLSDGTGSFRGAAVIQRLFGAGSTQGFIDAFHRHGYWVIAINRFLPGLRAGVFLMSGALNLGWLRVLMLGFISHSVWSALLLGVGLTIGDNLEKIQTFLSVYRYGAAGIIIAFVGVFAYRKWAAHRN
jgi:membrane protein DedA with SNARE-associated domain